MTTQAELLTDAFMRRMLVLPGAPFFRATKEQRKHNVKYCYDMLRRESDKRFTIVGFCFFKRRRTVRLFAE